MHRGGPAPQGGARAHGGGGAAARGARGGRPPRAPAGVHTHGGAACEARQGVDADYTTRLAEYVRLVVIL